MIFNMTGGANPLNFKVVGNPKPANPKENTIWIDTDIPIPFYVMCPPVPVPMPYVEEGCVLIETGNSLTAAFNALKKNAIVVCPTVAKQYVNGALVNKSAEVYQNGAWVDLWDGHLLNGANKFELVTGGWKSATTCKMYTSQSGNATGKATFNSNGIVFGNDTTIVNTANKIDMTNYSKLKFTISASTGLFLFAVMASVTGSMEANYSAIKNSNGVTTGTVTIDISSLKGSYYVVIGQDGEYTGTISEILLEV